MKHMDEYFAPFEDQLEKVFRADSGFVINSFDAYAGVSFEYRELPVEIIFKWEDRYQDAIIVVAQVKKFKSDCYTEVYKHKIKTKDIREDIVYTILNNINHAVKSATDPMEVLKCFGFPKYVEDALFQLVQHYWGSIPLR